MAAEYGCSQGKVTHLETGRYQQQPEDIAGLLRIYGASEAETNRLITLADFSDHRTWWAPWSHAVPEWMRLFLGLEGFATTEFVYEPVYVPGLLQTEEYAGLLTGATGFVRSDHRDHLVELRRTRAERVFSDQSPLSLHAVVEEGVLRRTIGGPDLMQRQYRHLLEAARRPNVTIQVVRSVDGFESGTSGEFFVLGFDKARDVGYTELIDDAVYVHDLKRVTSYTMMAKNLSVAALSSDASVALIKSLIEAS